MDKKAELDNLLEKAKLYAKFIDDQIDLAKGDLSKSALYPVPSLLTGQLRPYQVVGFNWIAQLYENGL